MAVIGVMDNRLWDKGETRKSGVCSVAMTVSSIAPPLVKLVAFCLTANRET